MQFVAVRSVTPDSGGKRIELTCADISRDCQSGVALMMASRLDDSEKRTAHFTMRGLLIKN